MPQELQSQHVPVTRQGAGFESSDVRVANLFRSCAEIAFTGAEISAEDPYLTEQAEILKMAREQQRDQLQSDTAQFIGQGLGNNSLYSTLN